MADWSAEVSVCGVPVHGGIDDLLAFTRLSNSNSVVLTIPVAEPGPLKEVIRRPRQLPLNGRIVAGELAME